MGKKAILILNNATGPVSVTLAGVPNTYNIKSSITNGSLSGATTIQYDNGAEVTVVPNTGYNLPTTVTVTNATQSYTSSSGKLVLSNCKGEVTVSGTCAPKTYTITKTIYYGTASGATTITYGSTATVTISPNTDYMLPTSVTVSGATFSYNSSTGVITLSNATGNVTITATCPEKPKAAKGDIIQMSLGNATPAAGTNNQYRVLNISGTVAEVVAMFDISTSQKFNSSSQTYSGSLLDTALNTTWYNTLSTTAKAAIVDKTITQYTYSYNSSTYSSSSHASYADYSTKVVKGSGLTRHIYALDVEDIEMYFGGTGGSASSNTKGTFSTSDIWKLFWNTTSQPSTITYPWLRSAYADYSHDCWRVYGYSGCIGSSSYSSSYASRPAFKIDLSKIPFEIVS